MHTTHSETPKNPLDIKIKYCLYGYGVFVFILFFFPMLTRFIRPSNIASVQNKDKGMLDSIVPDLSRGVVKGETIHGFPVTSPFLPCIDGKTDCRVHPVTGKLSAHRGVDLATPVGTPLYNPYKTDAIVKCDNEPSGAGIYATVTPTAITDTLLVTRIFHLNTCTPGTFKPGAIFATTGNTGMSTGAHAHIELIKNKTHIQPKFGIVFALLSGQQPNPIAARGRDYE